MLFSFIFSSINAKLANERSFAYISLTFYISYANLTLLKPEADNASKIVIG